MNKEINYKAFDSFPLLESKRLRLRHFKKEDAHDFFEIRTNKRVMAFMDSYPLENLQAAEQFIANNLLSFQEKKGINWAIEEKISGRFAGYFGFWRLIPSNVRAEIGYALHPNFWGKGYMQECFELALPFAFNNLKVHSLMANVNPNNKSSIKLLEKHQFIQEAHFKEDYFFDGKFVDSLIFSLLEP